MNDQATQILKILTDYAKDKSLTPEQAKTAGEMIKTVESFLQEQAAGQETGKYVIIRRRIGYHVLDVCAIFEGEKETIENDFYHCKRNPQDTYIIVPAGHSAEVAEILNNKFYSEQAVEALGGEWL